MKQKFLTVWYAAVFWSYDLILYAFGKSDLSLMYGRQCVSDSKAMVLSGDRNKENLIDQGKYREMFSNLMLSEE